MKTVRISPKILGITLLTAIFALPAQSAMADFSWSIGYSHGDKHHHRRPHYKKKHYKHSHYRPYKFHHKYRGHGYHGRHGHHRYNRKHHGYYRDRYDRFGRHFGHAHFGHNHGLLVSLPRRGHYRHHHGHKYYVHAGTYYKHSDCGYYRVDAPVEIHKHYHASSPQSKVTHVYESDLDSSADASEFVINIKNSDGEYTKIKIKKHYHGYMGPQGEYYDSFPEVAQLKAMYVR